MSNNPNISESVLEKIREGGVSMHSKQYFRSRKAAAMTTLLVGSLLILFVLSFVFFSVHESCTDSLLEFGGPGIFAFLQVFPWLPFLFGLLLIIALEYALFRLTNAYRFSWLRVFWVTLVLGLIGGIALLFTPIHSDLLSRADHDQLPLLGSWYERIHDSHEHQGVYRGVVASTSPDRFVITHKDGDLDTDDGTWTIIPPHGFAMQAVHLGDYAYVAGTAKDTVITAYGVSIAPPCSR